MKRAKRSKTPRVTAKVYLSPEDYKEIEGMSLKHSLTVSATIEGLLLRYGIPGYKAARNGKKPKAPTRKPSKPKNQEPEDE